jgi:hypothetical protein
MLTIEKANVSSIFISFIFRLWKLKLNRSFPSAKFRHEILRMLKRENDKGLLETSFIIRDKYMAGYRHHKDLGLLMENRKEYYENLIHSDLSVCMRGGGNFSNRFYEALSLGRIPLFINTACQLPYENWIDYSKHTLWVEHNEIDNVGKIIQSFWRTLDENTYRNIQLSNRKLWEEYLSPEGFFSKLAEFLLETNTIS